MKYNSLKQVLICVLIVTICAVVAVLVKINFFKEKENINTNNMGIKEKYEYNEFTLVNVNIESLTKRYFFDYIDKLLNYPEEAYKYASSSLKDIYTTYDSFQNMISNKQGMFSSAYPVKYFTNKVGNLYEYTIVDQYNNKYTFYVKAVLIYEINIDFA